MPTGAEGAAATTTTVRDEWAVAKHTRTAVKTTVDAALVNRLTIFWILFFTVNALGTAIMAAMAGNQWNQADTQTKFLIVVAVLVSWSNTMGALCVTLGSRAKDGKTLISDGGTNPPVQKN